MERKRFISKMIKTQMALEEPGKYENFIFQDVESQVDFMFELLMQNPDQGIVAWMPGVSARDFAKQSYHSISFKDGEIVAAKWPNRKKNGCWANVVVARGRDEIVELLKKEKGAANEK